MILFGVNAQSQGIKLGGTRTGLTPGDTLMVPLRITGNSIHTVEIDFDYDQNVLTPQANVFSQVYFPSVGISWQANPYYSPTIYNFVFNSTNANVPFPNMNDRLIGYFCFIYTGGTTGTTNIHLRKPPTIPYCGFWNYLANVIPINTYSNDFTISGSTGISTTVLYSLPVGGPLEWDSPDSWATSPSGSPGTSLTPAKCFNVVIQGEEVQINGIYIEGPSTCNNLTINPEGQLTMNSIHSFTVNGNMLIKSDATGTGSFVDFGTTTVLGSTNVELAMAGNWVFGNTSYQSHLVSSPVANQSNAIFTGSLMNKWNEVTQNWDSLALPFITMGLGTGYAVSPASPGITATFSGNLNTGDKTITGLTNTGSAAYSGYNLVGNPFPSSINWNTNVLLTNVNPTAWVWNGAGAYIASTQTIGGVIAPEQGFFVQATGSGSITIPNSERFHGATFYKSATTDLLTLKVEGNNYWDQTQIHVNSMATAGYESAFDAHKMIGGYDAPQIYSMLPEEQLSINSVPSLNGSPAIQLGFLAGSTNTFTITASDMESFTSNTEFYLEDLIANKVQNLKTNPVYSFTASQGQQEHRFNLHFSPVGIHDGTASTGMKIYSSEKTVYVNISSELKGAIVVYDMTGREVSRTEIQSLTLNRINLNVPTGFYLVKVEGDTYTSTGKVFIK